jgi:hypothetical protein
LKINLVQYKSGGKMTKAAKVAAGSERIMVEEVATTDKDVIVVEDTVVEEIIEVFIMGMDTAEVALYRGGSHRGNPARGRILIKF